MSCRRVAPRLVDLVDHHDRLEAKFKRLLQYETSLRHRTFLCVNNQQHRVDRAKHALHFRAEVGVSWCINNVDLGALVGDGGVFRVDSNTALLFDLV